MTAPFEVHEASIADLRAALEAGAVTAVRLLESYLARIAAFNGELNAVVVPNPHARAEAEASDARRRDGQPSARSTASRTRSRTATRHAA